MRTIALSVGKSLVSWSRRAVAIAAIVATSGCGAMSHNADCALVGGGVGAAGGIIVGAADSDSDAGDVFLAGGVGLLVGAAVGYGVCAVTSLGD